MHTVYKLNYIFYVENKCLRSLVKEPRDDFFSEIQRMSELPAAYNFFFSYMKPRILGGTTELAELRRH